MSDLKTLPLRPTPEMIEEGAKRLVHWEGECKWPRFWRLLFTRGLPSRRRISVITRSASVI